MGRGTDVLPFLLPVLQPETGNWDWEADTDTRQVTVSGQLGRNRGPSGTDSGSGGLTTGVLAALRS